MSMLITLPAAWASALVNGDQSGLDDHECALCAFAERVLASDGLRIVDVARDPDTHEPCEPYFTWRYRIYSQDQSADAPSGGDVLDYVATG
jgi:hypothetical protein